jgi:DNA-binding NtrC family response regulator
MPKNLRVLIVDDDNGIRAVVKRILCGEPDSVFQCQSVSSFRECLEVCEDNDADYVVLDLELGDRLGFEGLKELRETYPHIGVIVFTAHDNQNDALRAVREYNALAYITKPILNVDQFYKAFCDAIIRHESQKEVNSKVSKKVLMAWVGIVASIVTLLTAIVAFWERIWGLFK